MTCLLFFRNPQVQLKALNLGFVQYLLHSLNIELDTNIILRLFYALSTLLRNFPRAQKNFLQHGGAELMVKMINQTNQNNRIAVRAIALMHDIIVERVRF